MPSFRDDDLIRLLSDEQVNLRMLALHLLCEGYARHPRLFQTVLDGWDHWGAEEAFPEFPMLSYFPIPSETIEACCERATAMVSGRKLTDPVTRCAGKLIEQLMSLPAVALEPNLSKIAATVGQSKIFFRVDLAGLRERIENLEKPADVLAGQLNTAIATLCQRSDDRQAMRSGLRALEALRIQHSDYLDLARVMRDSPPAAGPAAMSFQIALQSLIDFEQPGLGNSLARHLCDERDAIRSNTVEALVRLGNREASEAFVGRFSECPKESQRWIARGLQRIRAQGLADSIAALRDSVTDPALWLMLLIAEIRQLDANCSDRISSELGRLRSYSEILIDSLTVYARLNEDTAGARAFQQAFMDYIQRSNQTLGELIRGEQSQDGDLASPQQWQQAIFRYRQTK